MKPIYFEEDTVSWLEARVDEWPESMTRDLNKIDKHNQKVKEILE